LKRAIQHVEQRLDRLDVRFGVTSGALHKALAELAQAWRKKLQALNKLLSELSQLKDARAI
jgi:hypothetical protein